MDLVGPHCHPLQVKSSPRPRALSAQNSQCRPPTSRCRRLLRLQTTQVSSIRPSAAHINNTRLPRRLLRRHTSVPPPAHHCYINCCTGHSSSHRICSLSPVHTTTAHHGFLTLQHSSGRADDGPQGDGSHCCRLAGRQAAGGRRRPNGEHGSRRSSANPLLRHPCRCIAP